VATADQRALAFKRSLLRSIREIEADGFDDLARGARLALHIYGIYHEATPPDDADTYYDQVVAEVAAFEQDSTKAVTR